MFYPSRLTQSPIKDYSVFCSSKLHFINVIAETHFFRIYEPYVTMIYEVYEC